MSKKLSLFLILILSVLSFGLLKTNEVQADNGKEVDFVLHKVLYGFGEDIKEIRNYDGSLSDQYQDFEGLNGVTFEVYDVTNEYYALYKKNQSPDEIQRALAEGELKDRDPIQEGTTAHDNEFESDGIVRFDGLSFYDKDGRPRVYLFHESNRPSGLREKTANLVVILSADYDKRTIHLYPKNESIEDIPFEKTILDKETSYEVGEEITFQMKTKVPEFPQEYEYFVIRDVGMENMKFVEGSLILSIDGVELENLYTLEDRVNGFLLVFDLDRMVEFAGKDMLITYTMFLEEGAIPDRGYRNYGELEYDNNLLTDWEEVRTGGYRFLKVDRRNQENTLADAHFVLRNNNDRYLHVLNGMYEWRMDKDTATIIESAEDGTFEVTGLKYGQYSLEEVKAPEGYILSNTPINFEVEVNTYNPGAVMNIINEPRIRLPITGGKVPGAPEAVPTEIAKRPALKLPFTGFYNNMWFSILGLVFISTALFINYKAEKREEE